MNKILTIIKREYITRVRKKSFIIVTLLVPFAMALAMIAPFLISKIGKSLETYMVIDETNEFVNKFDNTDKIKFIFLNIDLESAKKTYKEQNFKGILYIPKLDIENPKGITFYGDKQLGLSASSNIISQLNRIIEGIRYKNSGIDRELLEKLRSHVDLEVVLLKENSEQKGSTVIAVGLSYVMGFILYFILLTYGTMIMKGVVEEKTNRIIEVIVSSVKPFQLMVGKIIGITAVALTQIFIWIILFGIAYFIIYTTFLPEIADTILAQSSKNAVIGDTPSIVNLMVDIKSINIYEILITFIMFFTFGYFFYSSMFAALGAIVGEETENNSVSLIVVTPIMIAFLTMLSVIEQPNSTFAMWMSMIPFFSPIVMVARVPFDIPAWEIILSFVILFISFVISIWMSGKIYRTAILMYGKKITFKEIFRWLFVKETK